MKPINDEAISADVCKSTYEAKCNNEANSLNKMYEAHCKKMMSNEHDIFPSYLTTDEKLMILKMIDKCFGHQADYDSKWFSPWVGQTTCMC